MNARHRNLRRMGMAASLAVLAVVTAGLTGCAEVGSSDSLTQEESPFFKLLGPLSGDTDDAAVRDQDRMAQKLIAQCMTDEGFEYIPVDSAAAITEEDWEERQTEKWISQYGYGFVSDSSSTGEETDTDPNENYISSLSASQQEAYYATLYGEPIESESGEVTTEGVEYDPEQAGCVGRAYAEVGADNGGNFWEDEKYSDLFEGMTKVYDDTAKLTEVKAVEAKWAACMADAGYPDMDEKSDAMQYVTDKMDELYEGNDEAAENGEGGPSDKDLKALQAVEVEVALADFRCAEKVDYSNVQLKAQFALEQKFIDGHKAELDELVEAYGDQK